MSAVATSLHPGHAGGVYFAREDYAGFGRRLVSGAVDGALLWAAWVALWSVWAVTPGFTARAVFAAWLLTCYLYLVPLKASRLRTPGYRVAGLKIVDLRGRRPSLPRMTLRAGLLLSGAGFLLVDLLSTLCTADRQKVSDKIVGTYVVRARAEPAGSGRVVGAVYCVLSYFWVVGEVRRASGVA